MRTALIGSFLVLALLASLAGVGASVPVWSFSDESRMCTDVFDQQEVACDALASHAGTFSLAGPCRVGSDALSVAHDIWTCDIRLSMASVVEGRVPLGEEFPDIFTPFGSFENAMFVQTESHPAGLDEPPFARISTTFCVRALAEDRGECHIRDRSTTVDIFLGHMGRCAALNVVTKHEEIPTHIRAVDRYTVCLDDDAQPTAAPHGP